MNQKELKALIDDASLGIRIELNAVLMAGLNGPQCNLVSQSEILLGRPADRSLDHARFLLFDQMIRELPERDYGHQDP